MSTTRVLFLYLMLFNIGVCESPQEALTAYKHACQAGDFENSWALEAQNKDLPERLQQQQRDLARFSFEHRKDGSDFEILAERIDDRQNV